MIRYNKHEMKEGKCSVCGYPVMIDEIGNGEVCAHCGWRQDSTAKKLPDDVLLANPISLNKARRLYKEGKPFEPDFDDFIEFCEMYGEVQFTYNGVVFVIQKETNDSFMFGTSATDIVLYASIDEFIAKASIGGVLVKDLWNKIKNFSSL